MAEALAKRLLGPDVTVDSCGVYEGILDPVAAAVLKEEDIPIPTRQPQDFGKVQADRYDVVIALTPEAAAEARRQGGKVEFWSIENPTSVRGSEEEMMAAYRRTRDEIAQRIEERFGLALPHDG